MSKSRKDFKTTINFILLSIFYELILWLIVAIMLFILWGIVRINPSMMILNKVFIGLLAASFVLVASFSSIYSILRLLKEITDIVTTQTDQEISLSMQFGHKFPKQWNDFEHVFCDLSDYQEWMLKKGKSSWRVSYEYYINFVWIWLMFLWAIAFGIVNKILLRQP
ncbi:hypothetical protein Lepto7375DRAFT_6780 [Leptolyngbya sp. PCC 7375]|nr:hypothetical protein Lepto7375DRAFT_6780 [Leptolyngbya sp. PCC 7375]